MITEIPFPSLLEEFKNFKHPIELKAERVYWKCFRSGKYYLARKINDKYHVVPNSGDDMAIAFGWCLTKEK